MSKIAYTHHTYDNDRNVMIWNLLEDGTTIGRTLDMSNTDGTVKVLWSQAYDKDQIISVWLKEIADSKNAA